MANVTRTYHVYGAGFPTGLAHVGYTLPGGSRLETGVAESPAGSGIYQVTLTHAATLSGTMLWDNGPTPTKTVPEAIVPLASDTVTVLAARTPAARNQDGVTAPTFDDCLMAAWVALCGAGTESATLLTLKAPDGVSTFVEQGTTRDSNGNLTGWS